MISDGTAYSSSSAGWPAHSEPEPHFDVQVELRVGHTVITPQAHLDPAVWRMFLLALPQTAQVVVDLTGLRSPGPLAEVAHDVSKAQAMLAVDLSLVSPSLHARNVLDPACVLDHVSVFATTDAAVSC